MFRHRSLAVITFIIILLSTPNNLIADTILEDFQVNIEPPGHPPQSSPYSVANWDTETIYTTWLSLRDGGNWDVAINRFDYDLQALGEASYLNVREGDYDCQQPRLVISSGGVGAAWIEAREPNRILFRSLDAQGNPLSQPVRVEDNFDNVARDTLSIAALDGGYILVWYDERDSSKIWAQIVDFDGNLIGENFPIRPDSTGSILGLEAQNHPDGRVLISWVANSTYSRGRWLDSGGSFMGDVFDMAEAYAEPNVVNSLVRFNIDGEGILYQYTNISTDYDWQILLFNLDQYGLQTGTPSIPSLWHRDVDEGFLVKSWSDILCLPDTGRVCTFRWWEYWEYGGTIQPHSDYYNVLKSTVADDSIVPTGITLDYDLCQLNNEQFLYTFGVGYVGLRTYEIATLDSCERISWIYEEGTGPIQRMSDICVHSDGSFRIIYLNQFEIFDYLYTRFFDENGMPSAEDTVVSMNPDLDSIGTYYGQIENFGDGVSLVIWPTNSKYLFGTMFSASQWEGAIINFQCSQWGQYFNSAFPYIDFNSANWSLLIWAHSYWDYLWYWIEQIYYRAYDSLFAPLYSTTPFLSWHPINSFGCQSKVSLRDDGRFVITWVDWNGPGEIFLQRGYGYQYLIEDPLLVADPHGVSIPDVEKSAVGYWITWLQEGEIFLRSLDADGLFINDPVAITEVEAMPVSTSVIAVSDSSGNFAICWQDARFDEGDIFCRQFNPDGTTYGEEYRVNSDPIGPLQKEPAVAFGPEDRLYFTWTDFRNPGGQGDIYCKVIEWEDATAVQEEPVTLPCEFALLPPHPNPFNATTKITFSLPVRSYVKLDVFDICGRIVGARHASPLPDAWHSPGTHTLLFDGSNLASGIYILRLQAGEYSASQKLVLLK